MYISSTIAVPDVDRILLSVGLLLEQMLEPPSGGEVKLVNIPLTLSAPKLILLPLLLQVMTFSTPRLRWTPIHQPHEEQTNPERAIFSTS